MIRPSVVRLCRRGIPLCNDDLITAQRPHQGGSPPATSQGASGDGTHDPRGPSSASRCSRCGGGAGSGVRPRRRPRTGCRHRGGHDHRAGARHHRPYRDAAGADCGHCDAGTGAAGGEAHRGAVGGGDAWQRWYLDQNGGGVRLECGPARRCRPMEPEGVARRGWRSLCRTHLRGR